MLWKPSRHVILVTRPRHSIRDKIVHTDVPVMMSLFYIIDTLATQQSHVMLHVIHLNHCVIRTFHHYILTIFQC